jgi:hypothetical protein
MPYSGSPFAPPWRSLADMIARGMLVGVLLVTLAGCKAEDIPTGYSCKDPDKGHLGPDGMPDPCHEQDADAGGDPRCAIGEFVHWQSGWDAPSLVWIGPEDQAPECPQGPTTISYEGRTDLVAPDACEPCTCEPPTGSCALPSTLTASTDVCYAGGRPSSSMRRLPGMGSATARTRS